MNKPLLSKPLARNSLGRVLFLAVLIMMSLTAGADDKNFTTVELEKFYEM